MTCHPSGPMAAMSPPYRPFGSRSQGFFWVSIGVSMAHQRPGWPLATGTVQTRTRMAELMNSNAKRKTHSVTASIYLSWTEFLFAVAIDADCGTGHGKNKAAFKATRHKLWITVVLIVVCLCLSRVEWKLLIHLKGPGDLLWGKTLLLDKIGMVGYIFVRPSTFSIIE